MESILAGVFVRTVQGISSAAPTLITGLFIAAVLRYYLKNEGTMRLFGGSGVRSLAQSWLIGMLLPVCSIGVIPIIRELRRMGMRPGAITAFTLSAPLFNPLSLLYGLTLSRPYVILGFALGSLAVVTILGLVWDRVTRWRPNEVEQEPTPVSLRRLGFCAVYMARELFGPSGLLGLIAMVGLMLLAAVLPMGGLQTAAEQTDWKAPLTMSIVSVPIYATPMLTMSQLGMMFTHGNSPGAAFALLLLGTGVNLATLIWVAKNYGLKATLVWFSVLFAIVVCIAYAIDKPLIPPGVQPAGHTHAFDIYTNPFTAGQSIGWDSIGSAIVKSQSPIVVQASLLGLGLCVLVGATLRLLIPSRIQAFMDHVPQLQKDDFQGVHLKVSERTVGLTCLAGLVAFSVVGCFAYYYQPKEVLEDMRLARGDLLSAATSRDYATALNTIPQLEKLSRILEVGYAIRHYELRPYQRMQAQILRNKLELLDHACESLQEADKGHLSQEEIDHELAEIDRLRREISATSARLVKAFSE